AKKMAIKEFLATSRKGLRLQHLLEACLDEFRENEDLPNTTNPDDWARISGKKGERIVYIRTLVSGGKGTESGRSIDTVTNTGQSLKRASIGPAAGRQLRRWFVLGRFALRPAGCPGPGRCPGTGSVGRAGRCYPRTGSGRGGGVTARRRCRYARPSRSARS